MPSIVELSHDRREGGRWTPLQNLKNQIIYVAIRTFLFFVSFVPPSWLPFSGQALGVALYILGFSPRRIAMDNLSRVYPDLSLRQRRGLAFLSYRRLGSYLGATVTQLLRPERFAPLPFEEGSRRVLEEALHEGRGVLFASAHLGPWEQVAGSLVHHGFPLTTLARETYDPRLMHVYERLRAGVGVQAIYRGSPSAALRIVRTLRRGELLGAPMDLRSRVPSIEAPFLGTLAPTPIGPARIALRMRAAVVVGTAVPAPPSNGHPSGLAVRVSRVPTGDLTASSAAEIELTRRLNDEISSRIRAFPEGWAWMHPRWGPALLENSAPSSKETRYTSARLVEELH